MQQRLHLKHTMEASSSIHVLVITGETFTQNTMRQKERTFCMKINIKNEHTRKSIKKHRMMHQKIPVKPAPVSRGWFRKWEVPHAKTGLYPQYYFQEMYKKTLSNKTQKCYIRMFLQNLDFSTHWSCSLSTLKTATDIVL